MKAAGLNSSSRTSRNLFVNINRIPTNVLLLILFSILLIFVGALTSIVLFTYTNTINLSNENNEQIRINKELNNVIINNTREVPLQNKAMLEDLTTIVEFLGANFNQSFIDGIYEERAQTNKTLATILDMQHHLDEHVNATTDVMGTASHTTTPFLRNALYAVAAGNPVPNITQESFTNQLESLLSDLNQSTVIIQNLQEQVENLSTQVPLNDSEQVMQRFGSAFPFAENRIERADLPENESLTKEPEGGTIAGLGKPPPQPVD